MEYKMVLKHKSGNEEIKIGSYDDEIFITIDNRKVIYFSKSEWSAFTNAVKMFNGDVHE